MFVKEEYELALDSLEKAKNSLPDNSIHPGTCYFNIGLCYENYQKAIDSSEKHLLDTQTKCA
jgi:hypothetical protein